MEELNQSKSDTGAGKFIPAPEDINDILKQYLAGEPIVKTYNSNAGLRFTLKIPTTKVLNIAERVTAQEVGELSKDLTVSEYNSIKNTNVIVAFVESIGDIDFSDSVVKTVDAFNEKKDKVTDIVTAGMETLLLQKIFEFQQTELAAFNPEKIKNS